MKPLLLTLLFIFLTSSFAFAQDGTAVWGLLDDDESSSLAPHPSSLSPPLWNANTGVMWNEQPLRDTLEAFSKRYNIGFLLDRRVDPGTPLSLDLKQVTVRDVFEQAAAQVDLGFCELETVAYIGPVDAAEQVQLLIDMRSEQLASGFRRQASGSASSTNPEARSPKPEARPALLSPRSFRAEWLDTPVETLQRLAEEIGFDGTAFERLPHDVWPEIRFPNETPFAVFSLMLIGFDRTLAVSNDATKLAPIPIPRELVVTREYKTQRRQVARQLTETEILALAPDAEITPIAQGISIKAPLAQAAKIEMLIVKRTMAINAEAIKQQNRSSPADDALTRLQNERLTANVNAPLDKMLKTLADQMQIELVIDEESFAAKNVRLDTQITTGFQQATVTEVFEKCLAPVGAGFRLEGNTIIIYME